jgi:hypothetical protein
LSLKCNLKHNESDGGNAGKWEMGLAAAANTHTHRLSRGFLRACGTRGSWHIPILALDTIWCTFICHPDQYSINVVIYFSHEL